MFSGWLNGRIQSCLAMLALSAGLACAQDSPAGLWQTLDEQTGKPKSMVRISEHDGKFTGVIEKLFVEPGEDPHPVCDKCEGSRKGQPVIGMKILSVSGTREQGANYYTGTILDPENGKIYSSRISLSENGKTLNVHGYIGLPMLGRTQQWERVE